VAPRGVDNDRPVVVRATRFSYTVFTTASPQSLLVGDTLDLEHSCTVEQVHDRVQGILRSKRDLRLPADYELLLYLPGGLPFFGETLGDYYNACGGDVRNHRLYVVLTRPLGGAGRDRIPEVCNLAFPQMSLFLSPLYESSQGGLTKMACLLGYFQHDGPKTEKTLLALAKVTRFAPLIINLYRFLENEEITGLNLIPITATLHTFFRSLLPDDVLPDRTLNYTLQLASFASKISPVQFLKLLAGEYSDATRPGNDLESYCKRTRQQQHFVIWLEDIKPGEGPPFVGINMDHPSADEIRDVFETDLTFKPLSPKTTHYLHSAAILKGDENPYLFVGQSPTRWNLILYIDPVRGNGTAKEGNCDELARAVGDPTVDPLLSQLDLDRREQAIQICFDASSSMNVKLDGYTARKEPRLLRISIARNYLRAFLGCSYAYRLVNAYGLFSFASTVTQVWKLTDTIDNVEDPLGWNRPRGSTTFYDAIDAAATDLIRYFAPAPGYPARAPARRRILVISDGDDWEWGTHPVDLIQRLIAHGIVVDAVIVSIFGGDAALWAICDLTGGLAFRAKSEAEGLRLFEQEAFLNIGIRRYKAPCTRAVTPADFHAKVREFDPDRSYAVDAGNRAVTEANQAFPLASLLYVIRQATRSEPPASEGVTNEEYVGQHRFARILREVKYIKTHMPEDSPDYEVWVNYQQIDKFRVFFRAAPGSPFAGKWWSLYITFPTTYPASPPVFRFVNIPYHPNVSAEGRVLFSALDRGYTPRNTIWDLIVATRTLLGVPEVVDPLNREIGQQFVDSRDEFDRKARENANREGANSPNWPYTTGKKYSDADSAAIDRELDP
jgi:ubiquitin-protein ligase